MYTVPATTGEHRVRLSTAEVQWKITGYTIRTGFKSGALMGGLYGTFYIPIIGTIVGTIIGMVAGTIMGLINGVLLGSITNAWFYPTTHIDRYRRVMTILSIASNLVGGLSLILLAYFNQDGSWRQQSLGQIIEETRIFILYPTLIAAACPLFWRDRYIRWYVDTL